MDEIISVIILKEEFDFRGSLNELTNKIRLNNNKKFTVEWEDKNKFKFLSKISIGTVIVRGLSQPDGIKGYAKLTELSPNRTKVEMKTKIRIELYFFLILMTIALIGGVYTGANLPTWLPWLLPAGLLWFWIIYRVQEKLLFKSLMKYLTEK